jgi:hypothetical protein
MRRFLVVIERIDAGNYSAYSPDLPGCVATGSSKGEGSSGWLRPCGCMWKASVRTDSRFLSHGRAYSADPGRLMQTMATTPGVPSKAGSHW